MSSTTIAGVEIPRADKVLYPTDGITKADVAEYYADVAETMLPHLADRPVNMQRFPDGIEGQSFYEKKLPDHFPDWVGSVRVDVTGGSQEQVVVGDRRTLVYLAGQACLTPHVWLSRTSDLDRPDQVVFDLDPSDGDLALVRRATRTVREVLESLDLPAYLKTTGSRGYHVVVPVRPQHDFDVVRRLARRVAELVVEEDPDGFTIEQRKGKRGDRVFVDVLRNGYGQTAVPPYALRARPGAPVATPIEWDELSRIEPDQVTIASVRDRLSRREDPWKGMRRHARSLDKALEKL